MARDVMCARMRQFRIAPVGLLLSLVLLVAGPTCSSHALTTSFQAQGSRVASVWHTRSASFAGRARSSHVGLRKASIVRFTAIPSALPATGGRVRLQAVVHGATKCRFSSGKTVSGLPSRKSCMSGRAAVTITLPANTTSSTKTYAFYLTARGAGGTSTKRVIVVEHGATQAVVPPEVSSVDSSSFSGYQATQNDANEVFTAASVNWTVPAVTCPPGANGFTPEWLGIDTEQGGTQQNSLAQDGTQGVCSSGTAEYSAWYEEVLDNQSIVSGELLNPTSYPVSPGDAFAATVSISGDTWTLSMADTTKGWTWSHSTPNSLPTFDYDTVNILVEKNAGSQEGLADFGAIDFTGATAELDGNTRPITAYTLAAYTMTNGSTLEAAPSRIDPEGDFTDTWYAN
jgi:hypothetical protein